LEPLKGQLRLIESTGAVMPDIKASKLGMLKIIYIIVNCLIIIALLFAVFSSIIKGEGRDGIISFIWIMFFYILGVTLGIPFLVLNIVFFIKGKAILFLVLSIVSFLWVLFSVIIWITTGGTLM
jgi:hypothetical protein